MRCRRLLSRLFMFRRIRGGWILLELKLFKYLEFEHK